MCRTFYESTYRNTAFVEWEKFVSPIDIIFLGVLFENCKILVIRVKIFKQLQKRRIWKT